MGLFDDYLQPAASNARPTINPVHRDFAVRTMIGEAANEPDEGLAAVGHVIMNRVNSGKYGPDIPRVVLAKHQFEPWTTRAAELRAIKETDPAYQRAASIFDRVSSGELPDPTGGMTHFYSPTAQAALGRPPPKWAQGEQLPIGRHTFFAPEGRVQATDMSAQTRTAAPEAGGIFSDWLSKPAPAATAESPEALPDTGGRFTDNPGQSFRTAREGESPTVATTGEGIKSGFFKGATFNFIDELKANAEAGGIDPNDPDGARALVALLKGAYKRIGGDPEADATYRAAVSRLRQEQERIAEQQPGATLAGEVLGAGIVPVGAVARAPTLAARTSAGIKTGAAAGALSGLGEGVNPEDRAKKATEGLVIGSVGGAVLGPVAHGAAKVFAPSATKSTAPTAEALKKAATEGFESPVIRDLEVAPRALNEFAVGMRAKLTAAGLDPELAPATSRILARLEQAPADSVVTGQNLQTLRRTFQMAAGSIDKTERKAAKEVIDAIDELIPNLAARDILSGDPKAAAQAWKLARADYAAAMRSEDIAKAVLKAQRQADAAGSGANIDNATRQQFKAILNNDKKLRGFNAEEVAQMEVIVRGTKTGNFARLIGKAAPTGIVSGALSSGAGYAVGDWQGGILLPIAGLIGKRVGDRSTTALVNKLSETVRSRAPLAKAMEDAAAKTKALTDIGRTPRTISALAISSRNLASNLKDAGIDLSPSEILRSLQGPIPGRAEDQQPQ